MGSEMCIRDRYIHRAYYIRYSLTVHLENEKIYDLMISGLYQTIDHEGSARKYVWTDKPHSVIEDFFTYYAASLEMFGVTQRRLTK